MENRNWKIEIGNPHRKAASRFSQFLFSIFGISSVADAAFGGLIAFTSVHLIFLLFAFLIDDAQRAAIRSHQLHLYLVKFAVLCACCRRVGETVLVAQERGDTAKHIWHFTGKLRKPGIAAGLLRKRF